MRESYIAKTGTEILVSRSGSVVYLGPDKLFQSTTHRKNGPSFVGHTGRLEYCVNGQIHREEGPAYYNMDMPAVEYRVLGQKLSKQGFLSRRL